MSLAFTVRAMDAGPVLAQERVAVDSAVQAPELLEGLFARGAALLLAARPDVWSGRAARMAVPQVGDRPRPSRTPCCASVCELHACWLLLRAFWGLVTLCSTSSGASVPCQQWQLAKPWALRLYICQNEGAATRAAKLEKAEGHLDFGEDATVLHNKVGLLWLAAPGALTACKVGQGV